MFDRSDTRFQPSVLSHPAGLLGALLLLVFGLSAPAQAQTFQLQNGATLRIAGGGSLDLNSTELTFDATSALQEEDGGSVNGAVVSPGRVLNAPQGVNVAGLGAILTSDADLGTTTVARGSTPQALETATGIARFYEITPTNNTGLDATLVFTYDEDELNGLDETTLSLFRSTDGGATWTDRGFTARDADANTVTLDGIDAFSRWTVGGAAEGANTAPTVAITAPADGATVPAGVPITLTAEATDTEDGDLSAAVAWTSNPGGTLDTGGTITPTLSAATYTITASVTDGGGLTASAEITITVVDDTEPPVLTLLGDNPLVLTEGDPYTEPGAEATDNVDGDLTDAIVIDASDVDTNTSGTYVVTYDVTDAAGNAATAVRDVTVNPAPIADCVATQLTDTDVYAGPGGLGQIDLTFTNLSDDIARIAFTNFQNFTLVAGATTPSPLSTGTTAEGGPLLTFATKASGYSGAPGTITLTLRQADASVSTSVYFAIAYSVCADADVGLPPEEQDGLFETNFDPPVGFPEVTPSAFTFEGGYPNPSRGPVTFSFGTVERGPVTLAIYDVMGRRVVTLVDEDRAAGTHEIQWDGRSSQGAALASGLYLARLQAGSRVTTQRITLVR